MSDRRQSLDESHVFELLSNDRRRELLARLRDEPEPVAVSELAEDIATEELEAEREAEAGAETEPEAEAASERRYKSVYVSLKQTHLPKLAEREVIAYDGEAGGVEPGPRFEDVTAYLTGPSTRRRVVVTAPLVLSVLGIGVVLSSMGGFLALPGVSPLTAAIVFLLSSLVASAYVVCTDDTAAPGSKPRE